MLLFPHWPYTAQDTLWAFTQRIKLHSSKNTACKCEFETPIAAQMKENDFDSGNWNICLQTELSHCLLFPHRGDIWSDGCFCCWFSCLEGLSLKRPLWSAAIGPSEGWAMVSELVDSSLITKFTSKMEKKIHYLKLFKWSSQYIGRVE